MELLNKPGLPAFVLLRTKEPLVKVGLDENTSETPVIAAIVANPSRPTADRRDRQPRGNRAPAEKALDFLKALP